MNKFKKRQKLLKAKYPRHFAKHMKCYGVSDSDAPMGSPSHACNGEERFVQCLAAIDGIAVEEADSVGDSFFFQFALVVLPLAKRHSVYLFLQN